MEGKYIKFVQIVQSTQEYVMTFDRGGPFLGANSTKQGVWCAILLWLRRRLRVRLPAITN